MMKMSGSRPWAPVAFKPAMLANGRASLGNPALVIPLGWKILLNVGVPLLVGAGVIAVAGTAVKSAVPEIPINRETIGLAALTGGVGVSAYYLSDMLPEAYRPIAYALAVAGVASSAYFLFKPKPEADVLVETPTGANILPPKVDPAQEAPNVSPGWLAQMLAVQLDPRQDRTGGVTRSMFTDQEYAFSIRNQASRPLAFFVGLDIRDDEGSVVFRSKPEPTVIGRKMYSIPAGGVISSTLTAGPINFFLPQTITVVVQLFRQRDDANPFLESMAIPIKMAYPIVAGLR